MTDEITVYSSDYVQITTCIVKYTSSNTSVRVPINANNKKGMQAFFYFYIGHVMTKELVGLKQGNLTLTEKTRTPSTMFQTVFSSIR